MAQLQPVIGVTEWCRSSYIHPSGTIHKRYTNLPKVHKLEGLILVGESNRILCRKGVELSVHYFFHGYSVDVEFFVSLRYIHVV